MNKITTVAIIGGGVSGLSAGGLLARCGWNLKLFEANEKLGGSCANTSINSITFHEVKPYFGKNYRKFAITSPQNVRPASHDQTEEGSQPSKGLSL